MVADRAIFRRPGWEQSTRRAKPADLDILEREALWQSVDAVLDEERYMAAIERQGREMETAAYQTAQARDAQERAARSVRRAKSRLRDYVRSNEWDYFVTLTLAPDKVDRYNVTQVTKKLSQWADNQVRRHGLAYVLVPERHKDGAIHFHGFFRGGPRGEDSGTLTRPGGGKPRRPRSTGERQRMLAEGWQVVYNLPAWTLGFTTAIKPYGSREAATSYILKYITKAAGTEGKIGGRWYYSGGALKKPEVTFGTGDFGQAAAAAGYETVIPGLGARLCIIQVDGNGSPITGTSASYHEGEGFVNGEGD